MKLHTYWWYISKTSITKADTCHCWFAILVFFRVSFTPGSRYTANLRWKKVYLRPPVGKSQLRKTDARKPLPLHAAVCGPCADGNVACGTISNSGGSCLDCIKAGWEELPSVTRSEALQNRSSSGNRRTGPGRGTLLALFRVSGAGRWARQHKGWGPSFIPWETAEMWTGIRKKVNQALKEKMMGKEAASETPAQYFGCVVYCCNEFLAHVFRDTEGSGGNVFLKEPVQFY